MCWVGSHQDGAGRAPALPSRKWGDVVGTSCGRGREHGGRGETHQGCLEKHRETLLYAHLKMRAYGIRVCGHI